MGGKDIRNTVRVAGTGLTFGHCPVVGSPLDPRDTGKFPSPSVRFFHFGVVFCPYLTFRMLFVVNKSAIYTRTRFITINLKANRSTEQQ